MFKQHIVNTKALNTVIDGIHANEEVPVLHVSTKTYGLVSRRPIRIVEPDCLFLGMELVTQPHFDGRGTLEVSVTSGILKVAGSHDP